MLVAVHCVMPCSHRLCYGALFKKISYVRYIGAVGVQPINTMFSEFVNKRGFLEDDTWVVCEAVVLAVFCPATSVRSWGGQRRAL